MKVYQLDPDVLIGGVIDEDNDQQIVHLNLAKNNEVPVSDLDAIVTLVVLNGRAQLSTAEGKVEITPSEVVRLEPNEQHGLLALEDKTVIIAIKQFTHELGLSKRLRFGQCCL